MKDGLFTVKQPLVRVTSGPKSCLRECFLVGVDTKVRALHVTDGTWSPNAMECQRRCKELTGCVTWSYTSEEFPRQDLKSKCFVKSNSLEDFGYGQATVISGLPTC